MTAVPTFKFFSQPIPPFSIIAPVSLLVDCVVSLIVIAPPKVAVLAKVPTPETLSPVVRPTISNQPPAIVIPPEFTSIPSLAVTTPIESTLVTSS